MMAENRDTEKPAGNAIGAVNELPFDWGEKIE